MPPSCQPSQKTPTSGCATRPPWSPGGGPGSSQSKQAGHQCHDKPSSARRRIEFSAGSAVRSHTPPDAATRLRRSLDHPGASQMASNPCNMHTSSASVGPASRMSTMPRGVLPHTMDSHQQRHATASPVPMGTYQKYEAGQRSHDRKSSARSAAATKQVQSGPRSSSSYLWASDLWGRQSGVGHCIKGYRSPTNARQLADVGWRTTCARVSPHPIRCAMLLPVPWRALCSAVATRGSAPARPSKSKQACRSWKSFYLPPEVDAHDGTAAKPQHHQHLEMRTGMSAAWAQTCKPASDA